MVTLDLYLKGDGAFPELADGRRVIHLADDAIIGLAGLEHGMTSGKPSVAFKFDLPDGSSVLAETSLGLLLSAADALRARFGDPR